VGRASISCRLSHRHAFDAQQAVDAVRPAAISATPCRLAVTDHDVVLILLLPLAVCQHVVLQALPDSWNPPPLRVLLLIKLLFVLILLFFFLLVIVLWGKKVTDELRRRHGEVPAAQSCSLVPNGLLKA
jgi:hypothetical protein